jgi:DNA-binding MarR family transcriptional regulator
MSADNDAGGYQLPEVDRLIHEPGRYNIIALLYVVERAEFLFVQNQTQMTPGNLSSHLSKLEAAGYLTIQKEFVGKMPRTFLSLTDQGRGAFENYRDKMKELFTTPPGVRTDSDGK